MSNKIFRRCDKKKRCNTKTSVIQSAKFSSSSSKLATEEDKAIPDIAGFPFHFSNEIRCVNSYPLFPPWPCKSEDPLGCENMKTVIRKT
jgi:hypothetical protein